ncbi:Putative uncharacterized protein [Taphrina deformans PYCC 5710]|uniref:Uncharacterized protein n=1 Tax=Taphrina deformans (strain PYCC 5710 / ATCC 11124 / CBS 356.35 / IMI 108563 / JCM 9778 / NBRC 8474) TaxID=1097556 RepID=R4XBS0_TAPDE|nr:Putative uncharacterized protein [Taphrina deformans PYCC 5710]|eukprot:CCG81821.1 Putative uncharacterized protein [Taphrina deformans PYCC 5710]
MLQFLYQNCTSHDWFESWDHQSSIISIRRGLDQAVFPVGAACHQQLANAAQLLNAEVCFLMTTPLISELVRMTPPNIYQLSFEADLQIQIRRSLDDLQYAKKNQSAAFLRSTGQLLLWNDDIQSIVPMALRLEDAIVKHISLTVPDEVLSRDLSTEKDEKNMGTTNVADYQDLNRPVQLLLPVMVFSTILLNFLILTLATRSIVYSSVRTGTWYRFVFLVYFPFAFFLTSFFSLMLVVIVVNFVGPVSQLFQNSKYYSCIPPTRITRDFPHITIQCPVYKEDLEDVIVPTVQSLRKAISTYERQGGTASIFINDDGLQLVSPQQREMRKAYYAMNDIGWVARPGHGKNGFFRAGRFKKASNMNFAMDISLKVEGKLELVQRGETWTDIDEDHVYKQTVEAVIAEELERTGHQAWSAGNIRMGDLILLIDSDTRVPLDCFLDAASEFHHSPQVAIIQHQSGVMQVVFDFWENTITYFTQCIYFSLQCATASGDTAAFVGHNAFLRWSAMQEVSNYDETSGKTQWWSENHVSEDFEMSLKLQSKGNIEQHVKHTGLTLIGYTSRYATYSNEGFEEGVSLTCYDELLRWSKYAYGCSELVFNPFSKWLKKGPFTDIFQSFVQSDLNSYSKFTMISYIGTYYAIALWPMLILNYFVVGWYLYFSSQGFAFYNEGFGIFLTVVLVFNIISPISCAASRYRARNMSFWRSLYDNFKWSVPLCIFLGGLSMHLSYALIAHMCDLNIQWGATAKTLEAQSFFVELPKIWHTFKYVYLTIFLLVVMQVYFACFAAPLDRIWGITANGPLIWVLVMHAFAPLILNPNAYPSEWSSALRPYILAATSRFVAFFKTPQRDSSGYRALRA